MKLTFIGVGSAFALGNLNSNMLLEYAGESPSEDNKSIVRTSMRMLIDCGHTAQQALKDLGLTAFDIDDVYISHQHADHIGGLEWLGFSRYFAKLIKEQPLPNLYLNQKLATTLWNDSLRGGMRSHQGVILELDDFFEEVHRIRRNQEFWWCGRKMQPVQTVHIMDGYEIVPSYGLLIDGPLGEAFLTTDTQFCPRQIEDLYKRAWIIFQDCEAAPYRSGVHAHYDDLRTLPGATKAKMWLYHVNDDVTAPNSPWQQRAKDDGFAGFIQKGQSFEI